MHVFVDISAHGLGHLAQTAPVIAAMRAIQPDLRLTIASGLLRTQLIRRIAQPFTHIHEGSDFGFAMHNAIDIDFATSGERYRVFHADWPQRVAIYAERLTSVEADLVLANVAYLPLAAAAKAGIPSAGLCSLNWANLFAHYFPDKAWAAPIHAQIVAAYNAAAVFLRLTPGIPMAGFTNIQDIGPIAALAHSDRAAARAELAHALDLDIDHRWILVAMGGMDFRLPIEHWPHHPGVTWLCPREWRVARPDVRDFDAESVTLPFTELLAASDAVLTKPGYGTFTEAACNGVPVLYVPRDDWPEEAPMVQWMQQHARIVAVNRVSALAGELAPALAELITRPAPRRPIPAGAAQAAQIVLALTRHP